jgi:hypothetical protein
MTTGTRRRERIAVAFWLLLGAVIWNLLYDEVLLRETREYLYLHALHESGRMPAVSMPAFMAAAVRDAIWIATLWASIVVLGGLATMKWAR